MSDDDNEVFLPSSLEEEDHDTGFRIPGRDSGGNLSKKRKGVVVICCVVFAVILLLLLVLIGAGVAVGVLFSKYKLPDVTPSPATSAPPPGPSCPSVTSTDPPTASPPGSSNLEWWKTGVIYQCYPRSFQDSDGDGNGDLTGIMNRVSYLADIGVNAVWLNPIFRSPQKDNGYDISNYTDVDPLFGDMSQIMALIKELHSKGMHLILDFVPNHTSEEHPWFVESRQNRTNSKRDWYVWADGKNGGPPNNWISVFGGSAWTYDNTTDQYYLHQFSEFQPDLNYFNPDVRTAFEDVLRFWLDRGVDGFRIDAVAHLLEDLALPDEPINPFHSPDCLDGCYDYHFHNYTRDYHGIHNITRSWRRVLDSYSQTSPRFMVGEVYDPIDIVIAYYGTRDEPEFHFPFNFFLLGNSYWTGNSVNDTVNLWLDNMPTGDWPNWVLGNHDNHRIASKDGNYYLARALSVLLLTLPGTPTTYYGDEILMTNVNVTGDDRRDLFGDRDMERTPMQWSNETNAGFTTGHPWLPLAANYSVVNVKSEKSDSGSILNLYKKLVALRSKYSAFSNIENFTPVVATQELYAYARYETVDSALFLIVINFARYEVSVNMTDSTIPMPSGSEIAIPDCAKVYVSTTNRKGILDLTDMSLQSGEAMVLWWNL